MGIRENIKILRERYDLTQEELAEIAGVTDRAVSFWELGTYSPRMGAIEKLAKHFNLKKSNLIEDGGMNGIGGEAQILTKKINKILNQKGISNEKLSELSGIPVETIDKITSGYMLSPRIETMESIASALNKTILDFLDRPYEVNLEKKEAYITMTASEAFHLNLYRNLNDHGKKIIKMILEHECDGIDEAIIEKFLMLNVNNKLRIEGKIDDYLEDQSPEKREINAGLPS